MTYTFTKVCKCREKLEFPLTKIEAAFEHLTEPYRKAKCPKCGNTKSEYSSYNQPDIDAELFQIWSENPDYQFIQQDEDLLLAEIALLPILLKAFDDATFPEEKRVVVVNALCTLLFDNLKLPKEKYSPEELAKMQENKTLILPELQKRKDTILQYKSSVWDYIWETIYPLL